ncbi:MAG: hypothetical protein ACM3ML_27545 [Micromonosporaceae bacterium]
MRTQFENAILQRLADLKKTTAELERELSDTRVSLEPEHVQSASDHEAYRHEAYRHEAYRHEGYRHEGYQHEGYQHEAAPGLIYETCPCAMHDVGRVNDAASGSVSHAAQDAAPDCDGDNSGEQGHSPEERTAVLINHGRRSVYHRRLSSSLRKIAAGIVAAGLLGTILVVILSRPGASWPSSVATVQHEISKACQNPDVVSEPGQVNFACGKSTRQILWVFALMTSANNPDFADARTGRLGLEPITPAQGGEIASSLNLHHPYNPSNPIDSLQVAARAINNIIGGATLTGADGNPVVQGGLESDPANCARYTGSEAVISRAGFPDLCAKPVTSAAGQAALVADVYRKWIVGATAETAQDAAVLFENAKNPGNPRVQFILKHLQNSTLKSMN